LASGKQTENRGEIIMNSKIIAYDVLDSTDDFLKRNPVFSSKSILMW